MIKEIQLKCFKRFADETISLHDEGLTICAGPNSSGKSTLLHALAVWAFGVLVVRQFKGEEALLSGYSGQGAGLSDDDFTPISIPDLRHLWMNLKSQGGYTMSITVKWDQKSGSSDVKSEEYCLGMSFSLVQDRLYIKADNSNLHSGVHIPSIIYVPPIAGVDAREEFATLPKRRAMLGRGLAGSVLRNYIYDLEISSKSALDRLKDIKGKGKRLTAHELKKFRDSDAWERLNKYARETFSFELKVTPFDTNFHSIIRVEVQPVRKVGDTWRNDGVARDLMVEGSGAQQWLTVLTFALSPDTDVLLLDEPDAHLFTRLKLDLVDILDNISAEKNGPQILMATHATEILKQYPINRILNFGNEKPKYLINEAQRTKLISGLGDEYAPLIENARSSRALLIVENESDFRILEAISKTCGLTWPKNLAIMSSTDNHANRLKIYRSLLEAIDGLKAVSLRDRDEKKNILEVDEVTLREKGVITTNYPNFLPLTWRRREIENYALVSLALVDVVGEAKTKKMWSEEGWAWPQDLTVEKNFQDCDIKKPLTNLLKGYSSIEDFLKNLDRKYIHKDIVIVVEAICNMGK